MFKPRPKAPPEPGKASVAEADAGQRLDRWLKANFGDVPYIGLQKVIRLGKVRINGVKAKAEARLEGGDEVTFPPDFGMRMARRGESKLAYAATHADMAMLEECTVYEDDCMLVLNKPAGLPAQAGGGQVRSLDRIFASVYGDKAPKLVHRLDRETTGLIVCAKNRTMAAALTAQFAARDTEKTYVTVVVGRLPGKAGEIRAPLAKEGAFAKVDKAGDPAHTSWQWLASDGDTLHLLACVPHTGRMNQLRVHMAHIGLPMLGDDKYGGAAVKALGKAMANGKTPLYLHAWKLVLSHPRSGEKLELEARLPEHVAAFAALVGWKG